MEWVAVGLYGPDAAGLLTADGVFCVIAPIADWEKHLPKSVTNTIDDALMKARLIPAPN